MRTLTKIVELGFQAIGAAQTTEAKLTSARVPRLEVLGRDGHDPEDPAGGRR